MSEPPVPEWVVFHIPHDSTEIPVEVSEQFVIDAPTLRQEILRMTDHQTMALFTGAGVSPAQIVRAPVSRLVVDVERFENDGQEPMAGRGMGVVYTRTSSGMPLRRALLGFERQALIERWYRPHHERLGHVVRRTLNDHGRALVIDAHSFPSLPLPYEADQRLERPQVCIGADDYHTPETLYEAFLNAFRRGGYDVGLNTPFAGALVPLMHYQTDRRVMAVMIEVNRGHYMNESTGERNQEFEAISIAIRACIRRAIESWWPTT